MGRWGFVFSEPKYDKWVAEAEYNPVIFFVM